MHAPKTASITPRTPVEDPNNMRALLVQYLISVGTDPVVAEQKADQFHTQQAGATQAAPGGGGGRGGGGGSSFYSMMERMTQ
jgi:hypothetical protein